MNKHELVKVIAEQTGLATADVEASITGMFAVVAGHLRSPNAKVTLPGYLSFKRVDRALKVVPGKKLKDAAMVA